MTPPVRRLGVVRGGASRGAERNSARWLFGGLAAAAVVGALAVGLDRDNGTATRDATTSTLATGRDVRTAVGVLDSVTLSDGTRVMLGPDSRLLVSSTTNPGSAIMTLTESGLGL